MLTLCFWGFELTADALTVAMCLFSEANNKAAEIWRLVKLTSMLSRPGAKYIEKYSNTLQLLSLINDYNYITITGPVEM